MHGILVFICVMAWSAVQSWSTYNAGTGTVAQSLTISGATSGNLLVAALCLTRGGDTQTTPTGWKLRGFTTSATDAMVLYDRVATGTSGDDISCAWTNGARVIIIAGEYSGLDPTPFDVITGPTINSTGVSAGTGNATPSSQPGVAISVINVDTAASWGDGNANDIVDGSAWSRLVKQSPNNTSNLRPAAVMNYKGYTSTSAVSNTWTTSDIGSETTTVIVLYKEAALSPYKDEGVSLDTLFEPRTTTKRTDVGYSVTSSDISNTYETFSRDQQIPDIGYNDISVNLTTLFMGNVSQYSTASKLTSTRTTSWNVKLEHEFTITFTSATARTDFFKFGGRIIWSSSRTGGSATTKNTEWTNLLSSVGNIELGKTNTYQDGTITASAIGSDDLTGTYQQLYSEAGSGGYASSQLTITAKEDSTTVVRILITFDEADGGDAVDGTLTSTVDERRHPTETTPTFATTIEVTAGT